MLRNLKKFALTISILIITIISYNTLTTNEIYDKYYYQVIDNYNTAKYTIDELNGFSQNNDQISNLNLFYEDLLQSDINFLNINKTVVEFIGDWELPDEFANGYGHKDLTNQSVEFNGDDILITPVNAIHINKKTQDFIGKNWFEDECFGSNNEYLPIILGYDYRTYYKEFDEIDLIFMHEKYNGKVVGFLEKNEELILDDYWGNVDMSKCVVVPYVENNLNDYSAIIYKCNGYIYIEDGNSFNQSKKIFENMARKYNLDFSILRGY